MAQQTQGQRETQELIAAGVLFPASEPVDHELAQAAVEAGVITAEQAVAMECGYGDPDLIAKVVPTVQSAVEWAQHGLSREVMFGDLTEERAAEIATEPRQLGLWLDEMLTTYGEDFHIPTLDHAQVVAARNLLIGLPS